MSWSPACCVWWWSWAWLGRSGPWFLRGRLFSGGGSNRSSDAEDDEVRDAGDGLRGGGGEGDLGCFADEEDDEACVAGGGERGGGGEGDLEVRGGGSLMP